MKEERSPDMIDSDNLRLAMETATLPPSGELERYFLPSTARRMLSFAQQLECAVQRMQHPSHSAMRSLDPFAAKWLEKRERNAALSDIVRIHHRIQMQAHRLLQTEYNITLARPYRLPEHQEDMRQRQGSRQWSDKSRRL